MHVLPPHSFAFAVAYLAGATYATLIAADGLLYTLAALVVAVVSGWYLWRLVQTEPKTPVVTVRADLPSHAGGSQDPPYDWSVDRLGWPAREY